MKKKKLWKAISAALSAVLLATSVPSAAFAAVPAKTADVQTKAADENELKLWYDEKAPDSYEGWYRRALPLGNSGIGASVFGGITEERIQLNEKSLWSGGPSSSRTNYNGGNIETSGGVKMSDIVKQIQNAFANGQSGTATSLCNKLVGVSDDAGTNGYGYFLSYGNMYLDFNGISESAVSNYKRTLDLHTAVASVEYDYNGTHYVRENFVSYPDNVLVTRLTATGGNGKLNFDVKVNPDNEKGNAANNPEANAYQRDWTTTVKDGEITVAGALRDNQMKFNSQTKVIADDGNVSDGSEKVTVANATTVTIITSIATDYKDEYPKYRTGESAEALNTRVGGYVSKAAAKTYDKLKADHVADYQNIFERVDLDLGQMPSDKTTDELLAAYKAGTATEAERRYLEVMLFQYGRYLTIESSRETPEDDPYRETLPSNLQGIWSGANNSPWHSDYHMNVNLQMNYWPTYVTNMAECAEPLIDYVDALRAPGRVTAKIYAGVESEDGEENGFMAHTQNNPFGWTCPGWSFSWGWSPAAVPWILQNCWEYYDFTRDADYLKDKIYPMMKEEATLYDQILIDDGTGKLVSSPSYSPEHGPYTSGNTYEQTLVWQLYQDTIEAAGIVGETNTSKVDTWKSNQSNLKGPIAVGDSDQIKEWYTETTFNKDANGNNLGEGYGHRHLSHMLGLFPGDLITPDKTEWFAAAKVSMQNRTDESTGWGMAQRINTWARLGEGNKAYEIIKNQFKGGIYENLFDYHQPNYFQIDGNFGYTSGVAEMLLQSNSGYINLLPALPDAWSDGSVEGLVARGNFEVSYDWTDGNLNKAEVLSNKGGECQVQYSGIANATVTDSEGNVVEATKVDGKTNRISFNTEAGKTYTIKVPEAPKNVKANYYGESGTKVSWGAVDGADAYNVYRSEDGTTFEKVAENTKRTSFVDSKTFDDVTTVSYKVTAVYGDKESGDSKVAAVKDRTLRSMNLAHDRWTASAASQENSGTDGPASWAIDGNTTTIWHSKWSNGGTHPDIANDQNNEFTIDFGQTVTVNKFEYVPRSSGTSVNGIITKYKLLYSTTESGDDFVELTSGDWAADKTVKTAEFAVTAMRRIQIRALATLDDTATKNQHVTAAEFNVYEYIAKLPVMKNTDALWDAVLSAQDKDLSIYTDATVKAYQDALDTAKEKLALEDEDNMTQEQVDNALAALQNAESELKEKPKSEILDNKITEAETIDQSLYTPATVKVFTEALKEAKALKEKTDATDKQIQDAIEKLTSAMNALKEKADKSALNTKISEAEALDVNAYTEATVQAFNTALTTAQTVKANEEATQEEVNNALSDLTAAMNALEKKPVVKPDKGNLTTAVDEAAKTDLNGYSKETVDAFKKALEEAQNILKDENATKEQIENALAKLDAAKKALKKDTTPDTEKPTPTPDTEKPTPDTEKPTPTPETKVPAVGATTTVKGVKYAVTKSAAKGGTAEAVKVTGKGKKITIAATVKIDGVTFKVTSIKKNAAKKNKNMTSVVIGKNVTSIGANSFANSKKLANVTFKGTKAVKVGSKAFKGTSAKMKVVIPKKMSKKTRNTLKRNLKKAGISKKTVYKKK